jgi:hypothetical protein
VKAVLKTAAAGRSGPAGHDRILRGDDPALLDRIRDPAVGLAVWHRTLPEALGEWLDRLWPDQLPHGRVLIEPCDRERAIGAIFEESRTPKGALADVLANDIAELAAAFCRIANIGEIDLRLEAVQHNACWRFHRDLVPFRILTTYRGPGTQMVSPAQAARALEQQTSYRGPIETLPRYAVAAFKGDGAVAGGGIVHRSPPIQNTNVTRLLLCLNPASAASPAPWAGARAAACRG